MHDDLDPETRARFKAAFARLPWIQREIFRSHRVEGLTYAEIAVLMQVSKRFVERQMASAITKLMKQMGGDKLKWWERWF